jgi:sigma-54 dependent transcriptional regulator, acetoin dehydrogenase operon transcriptional activator AcoR
VQNLRKDLRAERERMLDGGLVENHNGSGSFRDEIVTSWRRCKLIGVAQSDEDVPYRPEFERPNRLLRAAEPVIDRLAEQLLDGPVSILLADSEAQIIDRRPGSRKLAQALDKALVAPGFHYAEEYTGTNGIGSALEERRPFVVSGSEHFRDCLQEFTCIGSPLRHPVTGSVEGVLDVSCLVGDAHELMKPLVLAAVREIESRIYADASRREQMLLDHFLRARRRAGAAVLTLNEDVVMANTAASGLLDLSDQAMLWDWACQLLGSRDECSGEVRLAGDVVVQARATRVGERGATAGVVIEMRPRPRDDGGQIAARPKPQRRSRGGASGLIAGRSVAAARLRGDIDNAVTVDGPLLICGEAGTGKLFVATYVHKQRAQDVPLVVLDARTSYDDPEAWMGRLTSSVSDGSTILLRRLDQLSPQLAARVEGVVESTDPARLLATARTRGGDDEVSRILDHFVVSITVPPLRYRGEDIADLAPLLLARDDADRPTPRLLPATLRTLTMLDWPGNMRELKAVLSTAAVRSLGSDITHEHLASEYRSAGGRSDSSSLRRAERDIVIETLAETRGNKRAAARRLGVARSTLYRKMRHLGIDENHLPHEK